MKFVSMSACVFAAVTLMSCNSQDETTASVNETSDVQSIADQMATTKELSASKELLGWVKATVMNFQEEEEGIDPYLTRIIVTSDYMRMDEGEDGGAFLLLDRQDNTIYSVTHHDQTILKIIRRPISIEPTIPLQYGHSSEIDEQAPSIDGKRPEQHNFTVNGQECYNVVTVEDFLDDERKVMQDYLQTLAGEQAFNLDKIPSDMQEPCMLANLIFKPTQHLDYGFPIVEWDYRGYRRGLLDYKTGVEVEASVFELPEGYRYISISPDELIKAEAS